MGEPATSIARESPNDRTDLSHEICNLVQVIDGYLELASRQADDDALRGYLEHARAAAEQLIDLSRQLPAPTAPVRSP